MELHAGSASRGSRNFSKGADFQKFFENFLTASVFRSTKFGFLSTPKSIYEPNLTNFSAPQARFVRQSQSDKFGYVKIVQRGTHWVGMGSNPRIGVSVANWLVAAIIVLENYTFI